MIKRRYKFIIVFLLLSIVSSTTIFASDVKSSLELDINNNETLIDKKNEEKLRIENEISKVNNERQEISIKLSNLSKDIQRQETKIKELNDSINIQEDKIKTVEFKILLIKGEIEAKIKEIKVKEIELEKQQEILNLRLREAYKQNTQNKLISILISSDGFLDFLDRLVLVERVTNEDKKVIERVNNLITEIKREEKTLEESEAFLVLETEKLIGEKDALLISRETLVTEQTEMQLAIDDVKTLEREKTEAIDKMNSEELAIAQEIGDIMEENEAIETQLQNIIKAEEQKRAEEARLKAQAESNTFQNNSVNNNGWLMPVRGRVTSPYGYRIHPIHNERRLHTGIDYGATLGTPIFSSKSGTVITSRYMGGYGNVVIVAHGNGMSTLYAHMSAFSVSAGDQVNQGQKLGEVGSTGSSTGPHLHFEIRINGKHTNPANYVN